TMTLPQVFYLSMISAQTLCVCREGKPVPTFPDHARGSAFLWVLPFLMGRSVCILPKFKSGNGAIMDLVRPVGEAHGAHRCLVARKARIVGNAGGAERLDRVADDLPP